VPFSLQRRPPRLPLQPAPPPPSLHLGLSVQRHGLPVWPRGLPARRRTRTRRRRRTRQCGHGGSGLAGSQRGGSGLAGSQRGGADAAAGASRPPSAAAWPFFPTPDGGSRRSSSTLDSGSQHSSPTNRHGAWPFSGEGGTDVAVDMRGGGADTVAAGSVDGDRRSRFPI
jgi:hypothetical protein